MGKRSDFPRRKQDAYDTPPEAVAPLLPHLPPPGQFSYWEPCAGNGALLRVIPATYWSASDIEPRHPGIAKADALEPMCRQPSHRTAVDFIITNPPWTREILHPMIEHFSDMRPTWLLFDADWAHTKQSRRYMDRCRKIVSVGRVSWMQNGTSGKDNCAWYLFDRPSDAPTEFWGRT